MQIESKVWIPTPGRGVAVNGSATYCSSSGLRMMQIYVEMTSSDRADAIYRRFSDDNGRTWGPSELLHTYERDGEDVVRYSVGPTFLDPERDALVLFRGRRVLHRDDVLSGLKRFKIYYQVSWDCGRTWTDPVQVVEEGPEYDTDHWMQGAFYGRNCAQIGGDPIKLPSGEILVPLTLFPIDENGELYNPKGAYTFSYAVFLMGRWSGNALRWTSSQVVRISPERSTRGLTEPALAVLGDGRLVAIFRGSNDKAPDLPGYKWVSVSEDGGRTWTEPEPLRYDDGGELFSPSSMCKLLRHSNGKLYWFGNVTPTNPYANSPRYPLVVAEVDEETLSIRRDSVVVIDDRREGEAESLQLSNFHVYEDRETGNLVLTLCRLFPDGPGDWTAPCVRYDITV